VKGRNRAPLTGAALATALFILVIQVYLFETVLQAHLDGSRGALPAAFMVSALLSVLALFLAFRDTQAGPPRG